MLCVLCFFSKAEDSQFSYDFPYKALDVILYNNEKLKQLEFEIKSLEFQAKSESKWDNVRLNFGYSNAEILMPFNPSANEMQNIFIGLEQDFDMNQKRKLQAQITNKEAKIKLLELKNLKNQYIFAMITESINTEKNKKILQLTQNAMKNLDIVLHSLKTSSNFNPMQIQKLNLLKAKLQIKYNDTANQLKNSHIVMSEISFEHSNQNPIVTPLFDKEIIKTIKQQNFIEQILHSNYDIQASVLRNEIAQDSIKLARKSYIPDITIGGSYMFRVNRTDMFALQVYLPMPLYCKEKYTVQQTQYQNMIRQSQITETKNRIKHNVHNLLAQLQTLEDNLNVIDEVLLPSNQKIVDLYRHHSTSQTNAFVEFYTDLNEQVDAEILKIEVLSQISIIYWNLQSLKGAI